MFFKKLKNLFLGITICIFLFFLKFCTYKFGINLFAKIARLFGPFTNRHKIALLNLTAAYPEKNKKEINFILYSMWENMGKFFAEYVFLERMFSYNKISTNYNIIDIYGMEIFKKIKSDNKPHIFFTAHIGNFEILPIIATIFNINITSLFRPPNNPYVAKRILKFRNLNTGNLVSSKIQAAWIIFNTLKKGGNIGMLVDQKFQCGILGTFFNLPVQTNPLIAKLAKKFNCDVYPIRCIRLPEGRFSLELFPSIRIPRYKCGEIDINSTIQKINDIIELWVREYPEQWMWFHKRWKIK